VDGAVTLDPGREYTQWVVYRRDELPRFRAFADSRRSLLAAHRTDLDLDRALALCEEGIGHLRTAGAALQQVDARVQQLMEAADGTFTVTELGG